MTDLPTPSDEGTEVGTCEPHALSAPHVKRWTCAGSWRPLSDPQPTDAVTPKTHARIAQLEAERDEHYAMKMDAIRRLNDLREEMAHLEDRYEDERRFLIEVARAGLGRPKRGDGR